MARIFGLALLIAVIGCSTSNVGASRTISLDVQAVASPEPNATAVAMDILARGGNAIDAAVALAFAIAVTWPEAGNLGGGGFILVRHKNQHLLIDCREVAPKKATRTMYLDDKGEVVPDRSTIGMLSVGVPGEVMGLWMAHEKFGSMPWVDVVLPAVKLAREGFVATERHERGIQRHLQELKGRTNFAAYFGNVKAGQVFKQPELANTLVRIAQGGVEEFYHGKTAKLIAKCMKDRGGLIDEADLANYRARPRQPIQASIPELGINVVTTPPPSSGGIALVQMLRMAAQWKDPIQKAGVNSTRYVHLIAEIEKRVFADRAHYLGDPDFVRVPVAALTSNAYCADRAKRVQLDKISETEEVKPGVAESPQTTHFSVLDKFGNAVSHTTTLNGSYGSGEVVDGAGFLLNNEMDDFVARPGVPNMYGLVGADANAVEPGKRMLSSMCPTIVYSRDKVLITGTPGGPTIFTSVFQVTMNVFIFGDPLKQAMSRPRFHHQLLPKDQIDMEKFPDEVVAELKGMGYKIVTRSIGDVHSILVDTDGVQAESDPRGKGKAEVKRD